MMFKPDERMHEEAITEFWERFPDIRAALERLGETRESLIADKLLEVSVKTLNVRGALRPEDMPLAAQGLPVPYLEIPSAFEITLHFKPRQRMLAGGLGDAKYDYEVEYIPRYGLASGTTIWYRSRRPLTLLLPAGPEPSHA